MSNDEDKDDELEPMQQARLERYDYHVHELGINARLAEVGGKRARYTWPAVAAGGTILGVAVVVLIGTLTIAAKATDWRVQGAALAVFAGLAVSIGVSLNRMSKFFAAVIDKIT